MYIYIYTQNRSLFKYNDPFHPTKSTPHPFFSFLRTTPGHGPSVASLYAAPTLEASIRFLDRWFTMQVQGKLPPWKGTKGFFHPRKLEEFWPPQIKWASCWGFFHPRKSNIHTKNGHILKLEEKPFPRPIILGIQPLVVEIYTPFFS